MAMPDATVPELFQPSGTLREDLLTREACQALHETLRLTRATRWDTVRSPHIFMGLLAAPDRGIKGWADRLRADLARLLAEFQDLFHQDQGDTNCPLALHREFFSDNVIRLLRSALRRAKENRRDVITSLDLL